MRLSKLISNMIDTFCRHTKPLPKQKWLCPADNYKSLRQKCEHAAHISQRGQRQPNRAAGQKRINILQRKQLTKNNIKE